MNVMKHDMLLDPITMERVTKEEQETWGVLYEIHSHSSNCP